MVVSGRPAHPLESHACPSFFPWYFPWCPLEWAEPGHTGENTREKEHNIGMSGDRPLGISPKTIVPHTLTVFSLPRLIVVPLSSHISGCESFAQLYKAGEKRTRENYVDENNGSSRLISIQLKPGSGMVNFSLALSFSL